jgi:hypothetical protein
MISPKVMIFATATVPLSIQKLWTNHVDTQPDRIWFDNK